MTTVRRRAAFDLWGRCSCRGFVLSGSNEGVTELLGRVRGGDADARERLFDALYGELRRVAAGMMSQERRDHTLQPTALVHEAAARLIGPGAIDDMQNRAQFFGAMGRAMRCVLVDHARGKMRKKRGGEERKRAPLDETMAIVETQIQADMLSLEEALAELEVANSRQGKVVELKFFVGLAIDEIAEVLDVSPRTVQGDWKVARAWLRRRLHEGG